MTEYVVSHNSRKISNKKVLQPVRSQHFAFYSHFVVLSTFFDTNIILLLVIPLLKTPQRKVYKKSCQNRVIYQSLNSHFSHYPTSFDISSESVNIQTLSHLLSSLRNYLTFSKSSSEPSYREPSTGGFSCIL